MAAVVGRSICNLAAPKRSRSRVALVAVLCAVAAGANGAPAQTAPDPVRRVLEGKYTRWARARTASSIAPLEQFLRQETTADFVFQGPRLTHTRQEELQQYEKVRTGKEPWAPAGSFRTTIDQLTVRSSEAIVRVTDHVESIVRDPRVTHDLSGKPHRLTVIRTNRDLWLKTPAGWRLQRRQVVGGSQSLNGAAARRRPERS